LQLLYNHGAGYRRQDSALASATGGTEWIKFPVLAAQIRNLSLLQYGGSEPLRVRQARIKILGGKSLQISADQIRPGHPGTNVTRRIQPENMPPFIIAMPRFRFCRQCKPSHRSS
jgi:hypothetical protein